jgi:hypothetical protein
METGALSVKCEHDCSLDENNCCIQCRQEFVACEGCSMVNGTDGWAVVYHFAPACKSERISAAQKTGDKK